MTDIASVFSNKRQTAQRYGISPKTIERWRASRQFPDPALSVGEGNGRRDYWNVAEQLVPWERKNVAAAE